MELYYENSEGKIIDFMKAPYILRDISELLNYDWSCKISGGRITGFIKEIAEIPIVINVLADTRKEYINACNELFSITETDILKNVKGRLYYEGQYVLCNLIGSKKKDWNMDVDFQLNYMRLVTDKPFWNAETPYTFHSYRISSSDNKRYPRKYPLRYANGMDNSFILNEHFADVNFKMIIYGPVINPQVSIGGTPYLVNIVLEDGEYLEIDTINRTVIKIMRNGERVSAFHNRAKGREFFVKIPPGRQNIVWTGKFDFDLILYEERSQPKWGEEKSKYIVSESGKYMLTE